MHNEFWSAQDRIDQDGYYRHGACGTILLRVNNKSSITGAACYCKKCRKEVEIENIVKGKISRSTTDSTLLKRAVG